MTTFSNLERPPTSQPPFKYGTISCGADTWVSALGKGEQVFSCDGKLRSASAKHRTNFYRTKWCQYPSIDLLIVCESKMDKLHDAWMDEWGSPTRARNILVFHDISFLMSKQGNGYKAWGKTMKIRGYDIHTWCIEATKCGASVWSKYLVTFCSSKSNAIVLPITLDAKEPLRACRNIIKTYGIPKKDYYPPSLLEPGSHPVQGNYLGTLFGDPVYHWDGPCGGGKGRSWIYVPEWGIRRLQEDEMMKVKGLESCFYSNITTQILLGSVEQHVWASICKTIAPYILPSEVVQTPILKSTPSPLPTPSPKENPKWSLPDLSAGGLFHENSILKLRQAITKLNVSKSEGLQILQEGMNTLDCHRLNYGMDGPTHLVILWWEWASVHWRDLRIGASMNFMVQPTPGIVPNQDLEGEELKVAIEFVDELIKLKVLISPPPGCVVINTFPLFLVPKPGQPGQYRTIADGKRGGQNDACVADPCHMTSPDHILPYLYKKGSSCTLDLSKYFHMFLTDPAEHRYMGLKHPDGGNTYVYRTLPMGTRNSPGASGKFGAAFIRTVIETSDLFGGTPVDASIQQYFSNNGISHPTFGEGRVLLGPDGEPAVLLWLHVDDILIHASSLHKLEAAMAHIYNTILRLGLICKTDKTNPPSHVVIFCGFEYNTTMVPTLHIPHNKVTRAVAIIDYLLSGIKPSHSRLIVSMIVGFLQSLVPATPGNIGAAFLRPVYLDLHNLPPNIQPNTKASYFHAMTLGVRSIMCLQWWREALCCGLNKQVQPQDVSTMGVTWGDGSGTGAGGTFNLVSKAQISHETTLDVWKGVWASKVISCSSNWKEMRTLLRTLEHELLSDGKRVQGRRLLYFTDNMVTYDVFRKGSSKSQPLWILLLRIKLLELQLQCVLQVVHVPGTTMITQGTDGLSRGVDMQVLASHKSNSLIPFLCRPAFPTQQLLEWTLSMLQEYWPLDTPFLFQSDFSNWNRSDMLQRSVFWCVSPAFARQAILQALSIWIESPTECGHIFLVPRIFQRDFGRISKFVLYAGQYDSLPLPFTPIVPFVLYVIPPFNRRKKFEEQVWRLQHRLDPPPIPLPFWIQTEIAVLHGLPTSN